MAGYERLDTVPISYGIQRVDHAVGNVHDMDKTLDYIKAFSGFHEFAEFSTEVCTMQSRHGDRRQHAARQTCRCSVLSSHMLCSPAPIAGRSSAVMHKAASPPGQAFARKHLEQGLARRMWAQWTRASTAPCWPPTTRWSSCPSMSPPSTPRARARYRRAPPAALQQPGRDLRCQARPQIRTRERLSSEWYMYLMLLLLKRPGWLNLRHAPS